MKKGGKMANDLEIKNSPAEMIRMAVAGNADLDKLEKLLALQERWEANEAKKAYNDSMSRVHANISSVIKTKKNPITNSRYASLDDIIIQTKEVYTNEGFSVSFYEGDGAPEGTVRICADITHRLGHTMTRHYDVPLDGVGLKGNANMTKIHGKSSATSYGRRYLMCMIFNIPTNDDNDGNTRDVPIDENKVKIIRDGSKEVGIDEVQFLTYLGVEKIEDILISGFAKAKIAIEQKRR